MAWEEGISDFSSTWVNVLEYSYHSSFLPPFLSTLVFFYTIVSPPFSFLLTSSPIVSSPHFDHFSRPFSLLHHPFPSFPHPHVSPCLPPVLYASVISFIHLSLCPSLHLSPGCHSALLPVGLPGHPAEGLGLHRLLHLHITPAGDTPILTAAQLRYTHTCGLYGKRLWKAFILENKRIYSRGPDFKSLKLDARFWEKENADKCWHEKDAD